MTRRLIVALDPDADTPVATQYAAEIAQRYSGEVTGLALVDTRQIDDAVGGGGIGAMHFAEQLRADLTEDVRTKARALVAGFVEAVEGLGARHSDDHVAEGHVVRVLAEAMATHDLLVVGREAHFYYADPEQRTDALARVVEAGASAVLVVPPVYRDVRRALVAYDGSPQAARALHQFVHLAPFGTELEVELVHVHDGSAEDALQSRQVLAGAAAYLRAYGFPLVVATGTEGGSAATTLLERAASADLVVAGAYGGGGLARLFTGSTTERLLADAPGLVFLFR